MSDQKNKGQHPDWGKVFAAHRALHPNPQEELRLQAEAKARAKWERRNRPKFRDADDALARSGVQAHWDRPYIGPIRLPLQLVITDPVLLQMNGCKVFYVRGWDWGRYIEVIRLLQMTKEGRCQLPRIMNNGSVDL